GITGHRLGSLTGPHKRNGPRGSHPWAVLVFGEGYVPSDASRIHRRSLRHSAVARVHRCHTHTVPTETPTYPSIASHCVHVGSIPRVSVTAAADATHTPAGVTAAIRAHTRAPVH